MPTFALLGATGQVGHEILTAVFSHPDSSGIKVNAFVRSKTKLENMTAASIYSSPDLKNYQGSIAIGADKSGTLNQDLASCLANTTVAILAVADVHNRVGTRTSQDTALAVVTALTHLKQSGSAYPRRLIILSSAETEQKFRDELPWPFRDILYAANINIYRDLEAAERYLRSQADDLGLELTFVKPGGLSHDIAHGHILSTEKQQTFLSFKDLAGGMAEIAIKDGSDEDWSGGGKSVSVLSKQKARVEWAAFAVLAKGLLVYWLPWLSSWLY